MASNEEPEPITDRCARLIHIGLIMEQLIRDHTRVEYYYAAGVTTGWGKVASDTGHRTVASHPHLFRIKTGPRELWVQHYPEDARNGRDPWGFAFSTREAAFADIGDEEIIHFREVVE